MLIFQVQRYKAVAALDAVYEVAASLYHSLVDQLAEGLLLAGYPDIEEELIPETAVDKMTGGMLRTSYVEVDVAPVAVGLC